MSPARLTAIRSRTARSFARMPRFERAWMLPAWIFLGLGRAAVLAVPFRRLAGLLGEARGPQAWVPIATPAQAQRARQVGRLIRVAARYTPWNSNCFAQALAARVLLGLFDVPCAVFFGVAREGGAGGPLIAHAWVRSGAVSVSGGAGADRYTVVASFAWPRAAGGAP